MSMSNIVERVLKHVEKKINKENEIPKGWVVYRKDKNGNPTGLYAPKESAVDSLEFVQFKSPLDGDVSYWAVLFVGDTLLKMSGHLSPREACIMAVRCAISKHQTRLYQEEDLLTSMLEE